MSKPQRNLRWFTDSLGSAAAMLIVGVAGVLLLFASPCNPLCGDPGEEYGSEVADGARRSLESLHISMVVPSE